jgi:hypothetical protein
MSAYRQFDGNVFFLGWLLCLMGPARFELVDASD